ncbi:MAG: tryptophan synthase subunit alpha [Bacteroidales bacterium]
MNRIEELFIRKPGGILSIYFTAGFPGLNDTVRLVEELEQSGTDLVEIGMPFSDPLADGPVIQQSSHQALENGMSLKILFSQLKDIRDKVKIPLILMGYLNPVLQYGMERFLSDAAAVGIDGLILPDLPLKEFEEQYQSLFEENGIINIFLITPQTSEDRIKKIDRLSKGFIYMVSTSATTGTSKRGTDNNREYFERVNKMQLLHPRLVGFGIHDRESFAEACRFSSGAIIGTAFIRALSADIPVGKFIHSII